MRLGKLHVSFLIWENESMEMTCRPSSRLRESYSFVMKRALEKRSKKITNGSKSR